MSVVGKYALGVAAMSAVAAFTVVAAGPASAGASGVAIAEAPGYTAVSRDGGFQAAAGDLYGALALSSDEAVVASAVNYGSWADAQHAALAECGVWDCQVVVSFRNACGAVAQGADYRFGWSWDHSLAAAERSAVDVLGLSAPPFPDLGSASPRPARVILSACTANV
ncbi:DUF4189 domain-containing protein [Nocardia caishijiensis]|uniref:Uncharacterized protein DUF4189 n=1 Tax=Nocardia caishijiensis TaxID=184756 RepID=A0ABQ6YNI8_9NOCA|nr:DUF4189 domain-containing protein [Nocardia caishijiensis]KAF0847363.1 uncharacterized protein DUF4189 [Nocardia caishijiensis]